MDVGRLEAIVTLNTQAFDRGIKNITKGFSMAGKAATYINQSFDLISRAGRILETALEKTILSFIEAADTSEKYRISLDTVLRSTAEGARMFDTMSKFAAKVPYEYEEIMSAATALSGVMKGGVDEVNQWMPMIADLATVSRMSIEDTTSNIIKMYSAGASAADAFRERGINAMLGFQAGVTYSAKETRERLMEIMNDPNSIIAGASDRTADTWSGLLSMMKDKWFIFQNETMSKGSFDVLKNQVRDILSYFDELEKSGKLDEWAQDINDAITKTVKVLSDFVKNDLPGHIETFKTKAESLWKILSYDPAILEYGLIGVMVYGRKGALIGGAVGHLTTVVDRLSKVAGLVAAGELDASTLTDFGEHKGIIKDYDSGNKSGQRIRELEKELVILEKTERMMKGNKYDEFKRFQTEESYAVEHKLRTELNQLKNEKVWSEKRKADIDAETLADQQSFDRNAEMKVALAQSQLKKPGTSDTAVDKETTEALEKLRGQLAALENEAATVRLKDLDADIAAAKFKTVELTTEYKKVMGDSPEINGLITQIEKVQIEIAKANDTIKWDEKFKAASDELKGQIDGLALETETFGWNEHDKAVAGVTQSINDLNEANAELLAKRPELAEYIAMMQELQLKKIDQDEQKEVDTINKEQADYAGTVGMPPLTEYEEGMKRINEEYARMLEAGGKVAENAEGWKAQEVALLHFAEVARTVQDIFSSMTGHMAKALADFAKTGKFNLKELGASLVEELRMYAAQKAAKALMDAASEGVAALISLATGDGKQGLHMQAAAAALASAPMYMGFIAGSGLAGMAESGITTIPENGTWLLHKNERVVDAETNADLKSYLQKGGGGGGITIGTIEINNSDEAGVMKALPALEQTILDTINRDISAGGATYNSIKTYLT